MNCRTCKKLVAKFLTRDGQCAVCFVVAQGVHQDEVVTAYEATQAEVTKTNVAKIMGTRELPAHGSRKGRTPRHKKQKNNQKGNSK